MLFCRHFPKDKQRETNIFKREQMGSVFSFSFLLTSILRFTSILEESS